MSPIALDDVALLELARAGHRWQEGRTGQVRYRWLLPPAWVLAATLPPPQRNTLAAVCGAGDREGRLTAVLAVTRGNDDPPATLVGRGARPGALVTSFRSPTGVGAERIEEAGGRLTVIAAHALTAGGEPYRFLIAALGPSGDTATLTLLRTIGVALWLADEDARLDPASLMGKQRLHG